MVDFLKVNQSLELCVQNSFWIIDVRSSLTKMNGENFSLSEKVVSASYIRQGSQARRSHEQLIRRLLEQVRGVRRCPDVLIGRTGWLTWCPSCLSGRASVQRKGGARAPSSSS